MVQGWLIGYICSNLIIAALFSFFFFFLFLFFFFFFFFFFLFYYFFLLFVSDPLALLWVWFQVVFRITEVLITDFLLYIYIYIYFFFLISIYKYVAKRGISLPPRSLEANKKVNLETKHEHSISSKCLILPLNYISTSVHKKLLLSWIKM